MMIRVCRHSLLLLFSLFMILPRLSGQQKDFQTWWELDLHKELSGGFELSAEIEQRFRNNSLQYDRTLITLTGGYTFNSYFDLEAGLRAVAVQTREQQIQSKFRGHMDATGRYALAGLDLSLRARLQYGFDDIINLGYFRLNNLVNRNRLKLEHHLFGTRFTLFGSVETWHLLNDVPSRLTYKMRYSCGVEYDLSFASRLKLRYILEDEFNMATPLQSHIVLIGYRQDF
jgi:hypothetical protein